MLSLSEPKGLVNLSRSVPTKEKGLVPLRARKIPPRIIVTTKLVSSLYFINSLRMRFPFVKRR